MHLRKVKCLKVYRSLRRPYQYRGLVCIPVRDVLAKKTVSHIHTHRERELLSGSLITQYASLGKQGESRSLERLRSTLATRQAAKLGQCSQLVVKTIKDDKKTKTNDTSSRTYCVGDKDSKAILSARQLSGYSWSDSCGDTAGQTVVATQLVRQLWRHS